MSEPAQALRIGDHVPYHGRPWQLVAVSGVWLTLRGTSMRCCAVLVTQLVGAADFSLLDAAAPAAPVVSALDALAPAERERLRLLEGYISGSWKAHRAIRTPHFGNPPGCSMVNGQWPMKLFTLSDDAEPHPLFVAEPLSPTFSPLDAGYPRVLG